MIVNIPPLKDLKNIDGKFRVLSLILADKMSGFWFAFTYFTNITSESDANRL